MAAMSAAINCLRFSKNAFYPDLFCRRIDTLVQRHAYALNFMAGLFRFLDCAISTRAQPIDYCFNTTTLSPFSPFFTLQISGCFTGIFSEVKLVFPVTPMQSLRLMSASLTSEVSVEPASLIASATSIKVSYDKAAKRSELAFP